MRAAALGAPRAGPAAPRARRRQTGFYASDAARWPPRPNRRGLGLTGGPLHAMSVPARSGRTTQTAELGRYEHHSCYHGAGPGP